MATKSILKDININEKHMGCNFISALENAEDKSCKEVVLSKTYNTIRREQIKSLFGIHHGE
ncbi:MAG: hypothetical protein GX115_00970 [Ruminiclostridium sp.]|nr:hypothetical protein [Ruminiclostridium sp.]